MCIRALVWCGVCIYTRRGWIMAGIMVEVRAGSLGHGEGRERANSLGHGGGGERGLTVWGMEEGEREG